MQRIKLGGASLIAMASALAWSNVAAAQDAARSGQTVVGEVVVTARQRTENVQDVPITVSVVSSEEIQRIGADQVGELTAVVPNINFMASTQYRNSFKPMIRGLGNMDVEQSFEPSTAVYVDGVYQGRTDMANVGIFDAESVQVAKGPQGTLFGRNTTAGAVIVTTSRPAREFGGLAVLTMGDYGVFNVRGSVDLPLVEDKLLMQLSYSRRFFEGYHRDVGPVGGNLGGLKPEEVSKIKLNWFPSENIDVLLIADYFHAYGSQDMSINSTGFLQYGGIYKQTDYQVTNIDHRPMNNYMGGGLNLTINWKIGDLTVTSITAGRKSQDTMFTDVDSSPLPVYNFDRTQSGDQFSQEIRVANDIGERFNYVLGAIYYKSSYEINTDVLINFTRPGGNLIPRYQVQYGQQNAKSYAAFGEGSYNLTPTVRIFGGLRWTYDDKYFTRSQTTTTNLGVVLATFTTPRLHESWSAPSYRLGLDWQPNEDLLLYGSYARGYQGGGFQGRAGTIGAALSPFGPQYSDAFELGFKADAWDRRLRLNAAAFYAIDTDLQTQLLTVNPLGGVDSPVTNVGEAVRYGLEFEATAQVTSNLRLMANGGWTHFEYTDFFAPILSTIPADNTYLKPIYVPTYSANFGFDYVRPMSWGEIFMGSNTAYRTSVETTVGNAPIAKLPGYVETSVNFGASGTSGWELSMVVNNLFDERRFKAFTWIPGLWAQAYPNAPRHFKATLSYRF